ncbi:fused response regulator/phosphatase [Streptomyces sp. NBC_01239]|uniref:fused response regulator/phosphatase n=1 Tax=Streptomyces sp. NBC_01239 TaxID=2903792 RepID=UPI0022507641|nr:fused response regulator/phosphatase [Streptomyces sp. NBC_01239]MCX4817373.1 fused response regulator/phosphatase [Streptomyces sp. NBC_01239]
MPDKVQAPSPATVLVIDDNETNRYVLTSWLRRAGHTVIGVATGEQGLARLNSTESALPDLAIIDVLLPDMSGFEVSERLKGDPRTVHLPVIQISAAATSADDHAEGLRRGADAYLDQPIDPGELLATVTATLRYARARQRAERLARRLIALNAATLDVYSAVGFHSFASAATGGAAGVLDSPASAVFLSPQAQAVHSMIDDPRTPVRTHPAHAGLLDQLAAQGLNQDTGVAVVRIPHDRWRALLPGDHLPGEIALAVARTKRGRPPVCLAVPAAALGSADDEQLFQQLANASALALEALRTYNEERALGLALQRSFLPKELPTVPGVELAFRYVPASEHAEIGGDFYEAVRTVDGLLLAIGDVVGHSVTAATVMGEVRHALRAYAIEGHPPHRILERLETLLCQSQPGVTVTLCLVLVTPHDRRLHIANAGHIPPLVIDPQHGPRFHHPHGPLLGLGLPHPPPTVLPAPPGTRLLLVTDGLVEVRTAHLDATLGEFSDAVMEGPADLEELCEVLLARFGHNKDDDIALIAALFS